MTSSVPSGASLAAFALSIAGLLLPAPAIAQVLYKWIDADGKVQYSDRPPKDMKGVTRIEPDTPATQAPAPAAPAIPAKAAVDPKAPARAQDPAGKRRAVRNELERKLDEARANLDAARKALAEASSPEPEERQIIQQQMKSGKGSGGMHGLSLARSNCRPSTDKSGKAGVMCAASVPNEAYFERIAKLEEAVRNAEEELSQAEQAWRRGVD